MKTIAWLAIVGLTLLVACSLIATPDVPDLSSDQLVAIDAAQNFLATELGFRVDEMMFSGAEPTVWPDACLGLPEPGETCDPVLTPGFRVLLRARGQEIAVRVGSSARVVRLEPIPGP
jgi:hypothetical protein